MSASTAGSNFRQDMPPEGGYKHYNWERTYAKSWVKPGRLFVVFYAWMTVGAMGLIEFRRRRNAMSMLESDVRSALAPFLNAESDRKKLRVYKKMRELEDDVMKDVAGWKTGTWWGEPIYYTQGDKWFEPCHMENLMHSSYRRMGEILMFRDRTMYQADLWYHKYMPNWFQDLPQL